MHCTGHATICRMDNSWSVNIRNSNGLSLCLYKTLNLYVQQLQTETFQDANNRKPVTIFHKGLYTI